MYKSPIQSKKVIELRSLNDHIVMRIVGPVKLFALQ
jgi:hypothetical protein